MVLKKQPHALSRTNHKVEQLLEEVRVVIPGTETLLAFQLTAVFSQIFDKIPENLQYLHLGSMALTLLCVVLLLTAPARHQIVDNGEATEAFHAFTSRLLLYAMGALAIALSIELYVVVQYVTDNTLVSLSAACITVVFCYVMWFGLTFYKKKQKR